MLNEENEKKKEFLRGYRKSLKREESICDDIQELRARKMENRPKETLHRYKYRVVELHKHNILLESMSGLKFCPDWPKFHEMLKGATLKPW